MSRIGKAPVLLPAGVAVDKQGSNLVFSGSKGKISLALHDLVSVDIQSDAVVFTPKSTEKFARSIWGTMRSLANNAVSGVHAGVSRTLDLKGVGFRVALKGRVLEMNLGYSHPVVYTLPEGVEAQCPSQVEICLTSCDKQLLGQTAANIRKLCPPEPYKGKGISYRGEYIFMKEGKKK